MSENNPTDNATDLRLCQGRDDEATTSTSTGSRGPRGKNAQYYRDYRARKRAEQEKESLNRTSDPSTTADSSTINVAGSVTSKKRKSAAEYQREYRARKKAKRDNILIDSLAVIPSTSTGGFTTTHQSTIVDQLTTAGPSINPQTTAGPSINPQTTAGSSINPQTTAEPSINPPTTAGPSTSSDIGFAKPTRRKTPAEYQREYRARKKAQRESTRAAKTNDGSMEIADENTSNIGDENTRINPQVPYTQFHQHKKAHNYIRTKFTENNFGFACSICDRLWFKQDLRGLSSDIGQEVLDRILPNVPRESIELCATCFQSVQHNKIPTYAVYNGFKYPPMPKNLPPLDIITELLISPRIPFMQIKRLRHVHGQYGIYGQIINVPVNVDTMVKRLPRDIGDDHAINVHIKKRKIHKSSYVQGLVNKRTVKTWLNFLKDTPLYHDIEIDQSFWNGPVTDGEIPNDELSEAITMEDSLVAQQQTLLWDEDKYLGLAPGENQIPKSLLFDEYAEELSFPGIYLGHMRTFREEISVTPFQMATSEIRRTDRRGVNPRHLLYMAAKNMRLRVASSLTVAFKFIGNDTKVTKQQIESEEYVNDCLETNLAFLKSIPNSVYYWSQRKKDLFAMIRQLGRPTVFLTMSANEIGWIPLLQLLQKFKDGRIISENEASELNWLQKSTLINEDAVTCAIYFDKLVNTLMTLLQNKGLCPFGKYKVKDYFKRIEFQHRGSPHAHILLWLEDAPNSPLGDDKEAAITLIDTLISVSTSEASGNIKLQTHKHTFTCYKKVRGNQPQKCRFEAPFLPSRSTQILIPMDKEEQNFARYADHYKKIKSQYEITDYNSIDDFYQSNNITSDEHYYKIVSAGINRPRVLLKREPSEKWHNPYNPFLFNVLKSNMDLQFILDEYSCAMYVVDYVNKSNRGISNLQRQILEITEKYPDFGVVEITRKMSVDLLNSVEISSQEAAWWLLRKPMSHASRSVTYIQTSWPVDRQRMKKARTELADLNDESTDIWKDNAIDKYERRPQDLNDLTLAQFCAHYKCNKNEYKKINTSHIIRYTNYNMATQFEEYKREMVMLHIPFRNEEIDLLSEAKFLEIYTENENIIMERRKEFESNINIEETMRLCEQLYREEEDLRQLDNQVRPGAVPEPPPFNDMYADPDSNVNDDLRLATLSRLRAIAKRRENLMPNEEFCQLMRATNLEQRSILLETIHHLTSQPLQPLLVFLTGPAGCGKTFVIRLIMEIYNKYGTTNAHCNAYLTCASTGKAAVAISGTTIHTALSLSTSLDNSLSSEALHQFRSLFQHIRLMLIDEVSMVGAELLERIDRRLKLITGKSDTPFGGLDVILVGDLRQLPPVKATPIFKQSKHYICSKTWRSFKLHELTQVMRQSNVVFSTILTKIGNGDRLDDVELALVESKFVTEEEANRLCPHGIRLAYSNQTVEKYNREILENQPNQTISEAIDFISGCDNEEQLESARRALEKKKLPADTGGLLKRLTFVLGQYYIITTNIEVADGLANGAMGKLDHIERNDNGEVTRVWLIFPNCERTGVKARAVARSFMIANNLNPLAVPIGRRNATIYLNRQRSISAKRNHFPLAPACGLTIHKSQGGTFNEVVYYYEKIQSQQLVYVAMSRAVSIEGLYIIPVNKHKKFYHGNGSNDRSCVALRNEMMKLRQNPLSTLDEELCKFINSKRNLSIVAFNCQSVRAHANDLTDRVFEKSNILMLSETFMDDNEPPVLIPNFDFIVRFQRNEIRNAGAAIYHNQKNRCHIVTPHLDIKAPYSGNPDVTISTSKRIGDICAVECIVNHSENNPKKLILIAIYISPNAAMRDIKLFIAKSLLPLSTAGSQALADVTGEEIDYCERPVILAGDFNVNFSLPEAETLLTFLKDKFGLEMINGRNDPTTKGGTTIDAVFARNIEKIELKHFVSYFSYHNPIVNVIDLDISPLENDN